MALRIDDGFLLSSMLPCFRSPLRCFPVALRIRASLSTPPPPPPQQRQQVQSSIVNGQWEVFAKCVSGEWDGYGAEFTNSGEPRELPSTVVPEAFREWEVQLYDWQTQCPTIVKENIHYRLIRLLPTVGCEADAATQYSIDERWGGDPKSGAELLAYHVNGSYIAVWPGRRVSTEDFRSQNLAKSYMWEDANQETYEIEHCFVEDGQPKFRVRILQQISLEDELPVLKNITVQRENWESEFQNGKVLGGCSTTGSAFATTQTLQYSELAGVWHCKTLFAHFESRSFCGQGGIQPLVYAGSNNEKRELSRNILALPKGLWSELRLLEDGHFILATGWLVNTDIAITSSVEFSGIGGKTKKACMTFEKRVG